MTKLDVAIELIIPDNTAYTVLTALRRLGYEGLKKVERSDHFFLTVAEAAPPPEEIVAQLTRAEVLFNPNKHRLWYAVDSAATQTQPAEYEALVADKDDNADRLLKLLSGTFGMTSLRGIERAVAWRLYDEGGPAAPKLLEWACQTLLSNPISQRFVIRPRPVRKQVGEPKLATAKDTR